VDYKDSSIWLMQGDCLERMKEIPDSSVDLILCDPPYQVTTIAWDKALPFDKLWEEYNRILKPTGTVLLFAVGIFTAKVILSNEKWYKQTLVWDKNKCGSPGLAKIRPMQVTEDIVVFAPSRTVYNPQMEAGEPYYRKSKNPEGYVPRCNTHGYGLKPVTEIKNEGTRYPKNIIRIGTNLRAQDRVHPTQKSVPLLEYLIQTYSNEGDAVLDNCMGSGSTGVSCVNTNRKFIGLELDINYFNTAKERILNANQS